MQRPSNDLSLKKKENIELRERERESAKMLGWVVRERERAIDRREKIKTVFFN